VKLVPRLGDIDASLLGGAVTIGNFDGVHRGHARIIERLRTLAKQVGGPAVVFTFDPHPARLLRPDTVPPSLTRITDRLELLSELGVDATVVYPTDQQLLALRPAEFFERIVVEALSARAMAEGPNFYFGRDREGNVDVLAELCRVHDLRLEIVPPLEVHGETVSSSRVREQIRHGDVVAARTLLGRPYRLRGVVGRGARRGATIGFPTANLQEIETLLPAAGVYAARAILAGHRGPAAVNIGSNPTFGEDAIKVEAHLVGFNGDIYGRSIELHLLARLRDIAPFPDVAALQQQLERDVAETVECERRS